MSTDTNVTRGGQPRRRKRILAIIPLGQIEPDPPQPRRNLAHLDEMVASVGERGVIQPILVAKNGANKYLLIAGERRFTAAKKAGFDDSGPAARGAGKTSDVESSRLEISSGGDCQRDEAR